MVRRDEAVRRDYAILTETALNNRVYLVRESANPQIFEQFWKVKTLSFQKHPNIMQLDQFYYLIRFFENENLTHGSMEK